MKMPLAHWLGYTENAIALVNLILTGMVSYAAFLFLIERRLFMEIIEMARDAIRRRNRPSGT